MFNIGCKTQVLMSVQYKDDTFQIQSLVELTGSYLGLSTAIFCVLIFAVQIAKE